MEPDKKPMLMDDGDMPEKPQEDFNPVEGKSILLDLDSFPELESEKPGDEVEIILRGEVSQVNDKSVEIIPHEASLVHGSTSNKKWIQGAIEHKGALRSIAKRKGLISGNENLTKGDLFGMEKSAKSSGDSTLLKRIRLARTLMQMRRG